SHDARPHAGPSCRRRGWTGGHGNACRGDALLRSLGHGAAGGRDMRILPRHSGGLRLRLDTDEGALLGALTSQLIALLDSHSGTALDPDPLFASLEVGGSDTTPEDPALARLLPDAYADDADASQFRRITEQGLLNRKLQDALVITRALGIDTYSSNGDLI